MSHRPRTAAACLLSSAAVLPLYAAEPPPQRNSVTAAALVRRPSALRSMVNYFNHVDVSAAEPWVAAAQYFGTKGFFADYDARPEQPLKTATALLVAALIL